MRWQSHLLQGYLLSGPDGVTLRVRTSEPLQRGDGSAGDEAAAWITLKLPPPGAQTGAALSRLEFEYPIPLADAAALLELSRNRLSKCRHGLALPGGDWVLDVFEADNAPLVVAEVELASAESALEIPPWCIRELTGRHDLSNAALAERPLARWSPEELQELFSADH